MKKIFLDFPKIVQAAVLENLDGFEVAPLQEASLVLKKEDFLAEKLRIGEVIGKITRNYGQSFLLGGFEFNLQKQLIENEGAKIALTEKEVALISFLHQAKQPQTRAEVLKQVWGYAEDADTRTVESHIHRLNQKFEEAFGCKVIAYNAGLYELRVKA